MINSSAPLFIFAGENSADLHGEKVLSALFAKNPNLRVFGVGGPKMRSTKMELLMPMEEFQVMGFVDVLLALPRLLRHFYFIKKTILQKRPAAVLLIDYPGFNLRLARHLRKAGYMGKICQYISPSVWAWGKKRIPLMSKNLDLLLTILPFEAACFQKGPMEVCYVGHPLVKTIATHPYRSIPELEGKQVLSLFPGSREKELKRNLNVQLEVAKRLIALHPQLHVAVSVMNTSFFPLIQRACEKVKIAPTFVFSDKSYELMRTSAFAIAKSGTVTLELALHEVPTVVTYGISKLDLWVVKYLLRLSLPYYCIVNILMNREVFPELLGPRLTVEALFESVQRMVLHREVRAQCKKLCQNLKILLTDKDASEEVAEKLSSFL